MAVCANCGAPIDWAFASATGTCSQCKKPVSKGATPAAGTPVAVVPPNTGLKTVEIVDGPPINFDMPSFAPAPTPSLIRAPEKPEQQTTERLSSVPAPPPADLLPATKSVGQVDEFPATKSPSVSTFPPATDYEFPASKGPLQITPFIPPKPPAPKPSAAPAAVPVPVPVAAPVPVPAPAPRPTTPQPMPPPASFGAPNAAADASPAAFTFRVPAAPPVVVDRPDPPAPKPVPDAAAAAREWNATLAQSPPPPVAAAPREPSAFDRTQRSAPEENASTPPVARRRPIGAAPVAGGVVLVIAVAGLVVVQPWNSDSPAPTATPIAVAPTPTPTPEPSATPEETPVVETTPTAPPAPTPTAKPVQTKVAAVRATPKPPATPAGKQPGAKFGARPSPNPADPKFIALDDGHRQMDVRRLSAAVAKYKEISETYPTFPDGHYWFAYASAMEGDAKSACTGFKRYVALAPKGYYLKSARQQSGLFCATTE